MRSGWSNGMKRTHAKNRCIDVLEVGRVVHPQVGEEMKFLHQLFGYSFVFQPLVFYKGK